MTAVMTPDDFPDDLKRKLLDLAERLPQSERSGFITRVSHEILDLAHSYRDTILLAATGWVLGELLDNILVINIPFSEIVIELTGDHASEIGGMIGTIGGFWSDCKRVKAREDVANVIARQLRASLGT